MQESLFHRRTDQIEPSTSARDGSYRLNCMVPCGAVRFFDRKDMKPYSVAAHSYERGYADRGEYEVVRLAS